MVDIISELEVSRATVKRNLAYMRGRMYAPIIWEPGRRGYCYADAAAGQSRYSLQGLTAAKFTHCRLTLALPFSNDPELIMRILSYGPDAEVLQPASLRTRIVARLKEAWELCET